MTRAIEMITLAEFGMRYCVSIPTIYRMASRGELKIIKIGRASRIRLEEAERWVASLSGKAG